MQSDQTIHVRGVDKETFETFWNFSVAGRKVEIPNGAAWGMRLAKGYFLSVHLGAKDFGEKLLKKFIQMCKGGAIPSASTLSFVFSKPEADGQPLRHLLLEILIRNGPTDWIDMPRNQELTNNTVCLRAFAKKALDVVAQSSMRRPQYEVNFNNWLIENTPTVITVEEEEDRPRAISREIISY